MTTSATRGRSAALPSPLFIRTGEEHDEEERGELEGRGAPEEEVDKRDGRLAEEDAQRPEERVGAELVVRARVAAPEVEGVRVRQLVLAAALGADELVLHDELALRVVEPAEEGGVAHRVGDERQDGPRHQRHLDAARDAAALEDDEEVQVSVGRVERAAVKHLELHAGRAGGEEAGAGPRPCTIPLLACIRKSWRKRKKKSVRKDATSVSTWLRRMSQLRCPCT